MTNEDWKDERNEGSPFDLKAIRADAKAGAKALAHLLDHAEDDWEKWETAIIGLRGLRDMAKHKTGATKLTDYAYRQEIARLFSMKEYAVYSSEDFSKQQRSACYAMMDHIEDVSDWYYGRISYQGYPIAKSDRMNWKTPQTILKYCPPSLIGKEDKAPKSVSKPRLPKPVPPVHQAEIDRLRRLVVELIKRLAKYEPTATELLDQVQPPGLANDPLDAI